MRKLPRRLVRMCCVREGRTLTRLSADFADLDTALNAAYAQWPDDETDNVYVQWAESIEAARKAGRVARPIKKVL